MEFILALYNGHHFDSVCNNCPTYLIEHEMIWSIFDPAVFITLCLEDFACGSSSNCGKENGVVVQVDSAVEDDVPIWSGIIAGAI